MDKDNKLKHRKFGIFYYDPDDPSPVVDRKNGMGTTINFGSKLGRRTFALMMIPVYIAIIIVLVLLFIK